MRVLLSVALVVLSSVAMANPPVAGARPDMQLEWNNTNPEQRQALDTFYQSLQNFSAQPEASQRTMRQQHLEQLRDMSSEQRQQMFRSFVQQSENQRFR